MDELAKDRSGLGAFCAQKIAEREVLQVEFLRSESALCALANTRAA